MSWPHHRIILLFMHYVHVLDQGKKKGDHPPCNNVRESTRFHSTAHTISDMTYCLIRKASASGRLARGVRVFIHLKYPRLTVACKQRWLLPRGSVEKGAVQRKVTCVLAQTRRSRIYPCRNRNLIRYGHFFYANIIPLLVPPIQLVFWPGLNTTVLLHSALAR